MNGSFYHQRWLWALVLLLGCSSAAWAHQTELAYLKIHHQAQSPTGVLQVTLADLNLALATDADGDGAVTLGEVVRQEAAINQYVAARLEVHSRGRQCLLDFLPHQPITLDSGAYLSVPFDLRCDFRNHNLSIDYNLLFDVVAAHRVLITINNDGSHQSQFASFDARSFTFPGVRDALARDALKFVGEGIWHIWLGLDHLLFLIALLIPSVFNHARSQVPREENLRDLLIDVTKIVSCFTLGHSLTLIAAAQQWINLPSYWVETVIALSVVVAGINIAYPLFDRYRWLLALTFGLIHGFGFANVLNDLMLPQKNFVVNLLAFNVGVELGQLAIVVALLPLLYYIRRQHVIQRLFRLGGATAITCTGIFWCISRSL